jgi:transposase-like protein
MQRDVSRNCNRRHLVVRGVNGRLMGLRKIMLTDRQAKAVERLLRKGSSLESIAEAIGVCRNTLQRLLRDHLPHVPRRGRACMDVRRRDDPTPEEMQSRLGSLRES